MDLNNPPYNFFKDDDDEELSIYNFITSTNKVYAIGFDPTQYVKYLDDFPCLLSHGYGLTIVRLPKTLDRKEVNKDDRVWSTIYAIVLDFIESSGPETVLLYHCDSSDNKQASRGKLFDNIYEKLPEGHDMVKYSLEVDVKAKDGIDQRNHLGFLCKESFRHKAEAILEMDKFAAYLIDISESK